MPGSIYVCVQILLRGLPGADAVARVVVGENVAVDASAEADVETTHLAQVDCVSMGEKHRKSEEEKFKRISKPAQGVCSFDSIINKICIYLNYFIC